MQKRGIVLIPVGCVEEHGVLPPDTDTVIAYAFCKLVADRIKADTVQPYTQGFCATTSKLGKTVTYSFLEVFSELRKLLERYGGDYRYLITVNVHNGNDPLLKALVLDIFQESGKVLMYFNPYTAYATELDERYFPRKDNSFKEVSLYQAGLAILGEQPLEGPEVDELQESPPLVKRVKQVAVIGFSYTKAREHIAWRKSAGKDAGLRYLQNVGDRFVGVIPEFKRYIDSTLQDQ